jgi:hypothetical protein
MKTFWGMGVQLHAFLTSALHVGWNSDFILRPLLVERTPPPRLNWMWCWCNPRVELNVVWKIIFSVLAGNRTSVQDVADSRRGKWRRSGKPVSPAQFPCVSTSHRYHTSCVAWVMPLSLLLPTFLTLHILLTDRLRLWQNRIVKENLYYPNSVEFMKITRVYLHAAKSFLRKCSCLVSQKITYLLVLEVGHLNVGCAPFEIYVLNLWWNNVWLNLYRVPSSSAFSLIGFYSPVLDLRLLLFLWFPNLFRHMVRLLGRVISSSQGLYLHKTIIQHGKTRTNIHALSGIRTSDPVCKWSRPAPQTARPLLIGFLI